MANTGFKGTRCIQSGTVILFTVNLEDSLGNFVTTGTTTVSIIEYQSDGTIKSYDFNDNTFKTTALTTQFLNLTYRKSNNASVDEGLWTGVLSTLTGFTVGGRYRFRFNNANAYSPNQYEDITYGSAEGDLVLTGSSAQADVKSIDGQATNGNNATLNLKQLNIVNSAGDALVAQSTGSNGRGAAFLGNGTGVGFQVSGGASGNGFQINGGNSALTTALVVQAGTFTASLGANFISGPGGAGLQALGNGTGSFGCFFGGGATGTAVGVGIQGGAVAGDALQLQVTSGNGMLISSPTGGHGITISATGVGANCLRMRGGASTTAAAIDVQGGATAVGMKISGGATSGDGAQFISVSGNAVTAALIQGDLGGRILGNTATAIAGVGAQVTVSGYAAGQDPATSVYSASASSFQGTAPKTSLTGAVLKLTSKFDAKTGITYQTDGSTTFMTQVVVTDATMVVPIRSLGVGA